jgi:sulfate transport system substrate-binding protein
VSLSVAIAACSGGGNQNADSTHPGAKSGDVELTLVSYAVTQAAYQQIIPKFTARWKQQHNQT